MWCFSACLMPERQKTHPILSMLGYVLEDMGLFFHTGQNEKPECFLEKYKVKISFIEK